MIYTIFIFLTNGEMVDPEPNIPYNPGSGKFTLDNFVDIIIILAVIVLTIFLIIIWRKVKALENK